MVEVSAWRLSSLHLWCEMSCSFSTWVLRKREFLALLSSVLESHVGKKPSGSPGKPQRVTSSQCLLLMAFPNHHPNHHPNLLSSARHPAASDFLTLLRRVQGRRWHSSCLPGEGRGEEIPEPSPGCYARASQSHPGSWPMCGTQVFPVWLLLQRNLSSICFTWGFVSEIKSGSSSFLFDFVERLKS